MDVLLPELLVRQSSQPLPSTIDVSTPPAAAIDRL